MKKYLWLFITLPLVFVFCFNIDAQPTIEQLEHKAKIRITPLEALNSKFRETNLSITPDGNTLFFMSDRGGQPWSVAYGKYKGKNRYDGDIWFSERRDSIWQQAQVLPQTINTSSGEDEPFISQDGERVYFQSWQHWLEREGPYYMASRSGTSWQAAQALSSGIHNFFVKMFFKHGKFATDGMCLSPDEQSFFLCAGANYEGNMDIFVSHKNAKGEWSMLEKSPLSTAGNERSVFMAADGKTLYFASDGYGGLGGLDIVKAQLKEDGSPEKVINIGEPFNTKKDDYGFILSASGQEAYFVREGDIYMANLSNANNKIKPEPVILLEGRIKNPQGEPIGAHIQLFYQKNKISSAHSNSTTGKFSMVIPFLDPEVTEITQQIYTQGYDTLRQKITIGEQRDFQIIEQNIELIKINETSSPANPKPQPKPSALYYTVFFEHNQAVCLPKDKQALRTVIDSLNNTKAFIAYITAHTDSRGSAAYNLQLSEKRAQYVRDFLLEAGIEPERIVIDFKGELKPVENNQNEEGRAKNRRAEILLKYP
ncbi:MAG: OmpA family protein [Bernardetiaceae bacterium]|nr:OmpA family protein [Bernardetiaceae bacterium]